MNTIGKAIREWWPVIAWSIAGLVVVGGSIGNLYWDVAKLKDADNKEVTRRLDEIEKYVNPEAMIFWNVWKSEISGRVERLER